MAEKFKYLEHTADAKFQAFGRTLEEAFANAVLATASLIFLMIDFSGLRKSILASCWVMVLPP